MTQFELRARVINSSDLPGHMFVRLEFTHHYTGETLHIMEIHLEPKYVADWIAKQIKWVNKQ